MTRPVPAETGRTIELFRSDVLLARAHIGRRDDLCVVVFDPMGDDRSLDRPAFAEAFLQSYGFDAVHVLSSKNTWYQDPALPALLEQVRAVTRGYGRVVTYGSSMGGYAALRFAADVGACAAIAISPQYTGRPEATYEPRWRKLRRDIAWLYEARGEPLRPLGEAVVLYDDKDWDRHHAERIGRDLPAATLVPIRHGGHPVGAMVTELGLLSSAIVDGLHGRLDATALRRQLWQGRRRSGQYLFTLARKQPPSRRRTKLGLARLAADAAPQDAVYQSYLALVLECHGEIEEALARHRQARALSSVSHFEMRYARCLWRAGRQAEAEAAADEALMAPSPSVGAIETAAMIKGAGRRPGEALEALARLPSLAGRPTVRDLLHAVAGSPVLRWWPVAALGRGLARIEIQRSMLNARRAPVELDHADRDVEPIRATAKLRRA